MLPELRKYLITYEGPTDFEGTRVVVSMMDTRYKESFDYEVGSILKQGLQMLQTHYGVVPENIVGALKNPDGDYEILVETGRVL